MNEQTNGLEVEKIAADRYRLRFRGQIITLDAQALLDVMDYGLLNARVLRLEAMAPASSSESGEQDETPQTGGARSIDWDALLDQ